MRVVCVVLTSRQSRQGDEPVTGSAGSGRAADSPGPLSPLGSGRAPDFDSPNLGVMCPLRLHVDGERDQLVAWCCANRERFVWQSSSYFVCGGYI
jgi:hypothetical protein